MNNSWSKAKDGSPYNLEALRREARKRDGIIHLHAPSDECSDFEHERFEDGELVEKSSSGMTIRRAGDDAFIDG